MFPCKQRGVIQRLWGVGRQLEAWHQCAGRTCGEEADAEGERRDLAGVSAGACAFPVGKADLLERGGS